MLLVTLQIAPPAAAFLDNARAALLVEAGLLPRHPVQPVALETSHWEVLMPAWSVL